MTDKLRSAEIRIGSRKYPVKLNQAELDQLHIIEKEINETLSGYQLKYKNLDEQDRISMALVAAAFDLFHQKERQTGSKVVDKIGQIQDMLDTLT